MKEKELKLMTSIEAPHDQVYFMFTNPTGLREFLADIVEADAKEGGRLYVWWNTGYFSAGTYKEVQKNKKITFSWHGSSDPAATSVEVSLEEEKGSTKVTLIHKGFGEGKEWDETKKQCKRGWEVGLENLKSMLETGLDQRLYQRPMLGFIPAGTLDEDQAKRLGVPIEEGIIVSDTVEGMGARAAGLKSDDVLVKLGGVELTDFPSLTASLETHKAGDVVEVMFYRGEKKNKVDMELSRRPDPGVPAKLKDLIEVVREKYADVYQTLTEIAKSSSEKATEYSSGELEWSAKETLAHLIASERDTQTWMGAFADGNELNVFSANDMNRLRSMIKVYGTFEEMVAEFKRSAEESIAMLGTLPEELVKRKSTYLRIGQGMTQGVDYHILPHLEQIRTSIAASSEG